MVGIRDNLDLVLKNGDSIRQNVTAFKTIKDSDLLRINEDIVEKLNRRLHTRGVALPYKSA
jgi:hypothetical protein